MSYIGEKISPKARSAERAGEAGTETGGPTRRRRGGDGKCVSDSGKGRELQRKEEEGDDMSTIAFSLKATVLGAQ